MKSDADVTREYRVLFFAWCFSALVLCAVAFAARTGCSPLPAPAPAPIAPPKRSVVDPTPTPDIWNLNAWLGGVKAAKTLIQLFCVARFVFLKGAYPFLTTDDQLRNELASIDGLIPDVDR